MNDLSGVLQTLPGFLQIVNIVVLLSALFFFTSTVSSHIVEVIVGMWNSRGKQLRARLINSLGKDVADAIYNDPLIKSLASGSNAAGGKIGDLQPPSYIEPEFFARVVAKLAETNDTVKKSEVINSIKDKLVKAGDSLEPKIIDWFKAINDRQNGVYTRWTFLRLILIGFLMAALLDIDTVHITGTLWNNPELAEKAAKQLDAAAKIDQSDLSKLTDEQRKTLRESVATAYKQLREIAPPTYAWQSIPATIKDWIAKLLGWLLTALATSL